MQPWGNAWSTLNKIKHVVFMGSFDQNGATIYFSKQDITKTVKSIEIFLSIKMLSIVTFTTLMKYLFHNS